MASSNTIEDVKKKLLLRTTSLPSIMPSELNYRTGPIQPIATYSAEEPKEKYTGKLEIDEAIQDIIALETDTALFNCKVVQDLKPTCTWHKDGYTLQSDDERISVIKNGAWYRLEIKHVTASDQGLYALECRHNQDYISIKGHLYVGPKAINDGVFYQEIPYVGERVIQHLQNIKVWTGETIQLIAKFSCDVQRVIWFKNNDAALQDRRTTMLYYRAVLPTAVMTIKSAKRTDTGIYYAVAETEVGYLSTFADVQVGDPNEIRQHFPIIDDNFPGDQVAVVGEEVRLAAKVYTDKNTIVIWYKDLIDLPKEDGNLEVDYGNNYIGLNIPAPTMSSAGEYILLLFNSASNRNVSASIQLSVQERPPYVNEVNLLRPIRSAVACCGSKISFDCRFDLKDPIYFYVVWYVGPHKVKRTNSLFNVISNGGQFLLYIKKVEPGMAGEVICELRRAWTHQKTAMVNRAYARLVIVPRSMIQEAKATQTLDGKLYNKPEGNDNIKIVNEDDCPGSTTVIEDEFLLKIVYCRLDQQLHFVHAVRGRHGCANEYTYLKVGAVSSTEHGCVEISWHKEKSTLDECWYCIDLGQDSGSFVQAGITSNPKFLVKAVPVDRMLIFRIRGVPLVADATSDVVIVPPPEIVMQILLPKDIEPIDAFHAEYTTTSDIIGTGTFGSVLLIKHNENLSCYAAKFVKAKTTKRRDHILREFNIMKNLRHPKLIQLLGFYEAKFTYVFVMEYCWGGELFDRVVGDEYMKETDVVGYVKQICEALEYIHCREIVHLDLKAENIICLSPNSRQVKLIDFGVARSLAEDATRVVYGTRDYMAPEIIDYEPISTATDMWSLGVLTYMLLSGNMPFYGETWNAHSANITGVRYVYDEYTFREISDQAKDFVDKILVRQPLERMSATVALQHTWIVNGPPQGSRANPMCMMRRNLKSYLADYRKKWQRAGNVVRAAHRLRMGSRLHSKSSSGSSAESPEAAM